MYYIIFGTNLCFYAIGYDVKDEDNLKKTYEDKFLAAYQDDDGFYQIDVEGISMEH